MNRLYMAGVCLHDVVTVLWNNLSSAFRKQVLSHLYGLAEPSESVKEESKDTEADVSKDGDKTKAEKQETDDSTKSANVKDGSSEKSETEKDSVECGQIKEELKPESVNNNGDGSAAASDSLSSKSTSTHSTPTTTTSHLYSVLMAPLDGHSTYRDHALRFGLDDPGILSLSNLLSALDLWPNKYNDMSYLVYEHFFWSLVCLLAKYLRKTGEYIELSVLNPVG